MGLGIKGKIMTVLLLIVVIPLLLTGFLFVITVQYSGTRVLTDTQTELHKEAEANLQQLASAKANETEAFFSSIQADTAALMEIANDIYNHPEKYPNMSGYPERTYTSGTVPYLPTWGYVFNNVSDPKDPRNGAWADWDDIVQATPYLNSSVVKKAGADPVYAAWLRDELNKTLLFDFYFKSIYVRNQPNTVNVWLVRYGGLTNSYSVPSVDYGELLESGEKTQSWDEFDEEYVQRANPVNNPSRGVIWTEPYFDTVGNGWMVSCLGPIYLNGTFIGDVGIDVQLNTIQSIVLRVKVLKTGHAFLIDNKGTTISHPDLERVRQIQMQQDEEDVYVDIVDLESNTSSFRTAVELMKKGGRGLMKVAYEDGKTRYLTYSPVKGTHFSLGIVVEEAEINSLAEATQNSMTQTRDRALLLTAVVIISTLLVAIVASFIFGNRITRPVKQLSLLADSIAQGKLDVELEEEYSDELRTLAEEFRNILITLRLGNVAYYEGDTRRAFENYKSALSLFAATGNRKGQAMCLNNLGNIYRIWKDYDEAIRHYTQAMKFDEKEDNKAGLASRHVNIGLVYLARGEKLPAQKEFEEAVSLYKTAGDKKGLAKAYNNLGLMMLEDKKKKEAMDYFVKAYELDIELNDRRGLTGRLNNIAMLHKDNGNYEKALSLLKKALALCETFEDRTQTVHVLSNMSKVYRAMGNIDDAIRCQQRMTHLKDQVLKTARQKSVIFVIDTSGSMEGERLKGAVTGALNLFDRKVYDEDLVSLIQFSSFSEVVLPVMRKKDALKRFPVALHNLKADRMTAFYDALGDAIMLVKRSAKDNMVYWVVALTDGEDNSSARFTPKSIIRLRDSIEQDLTIIIISVGDAVKRSELEQLCGTKGRYIVVGEEAEAQIGSEAILKAYQEVEDIFEESEVVEGFVPEG